MAKNKLLIVTTVPITLKSFLLPFAYYFRNQNWQVDAVAQEVSANPECVAAFDHVWDIDWSRNPLDPRNLISLPQKIREIVAQEEYDIVHVHTPVASFVTRYALRKMAEPKPKIIYTAHGFHFHSGGTALKNAIFLFLEQLAGKWTDHLVVINKEDETAAKKNQILPAEKVHYMPGIGVNLQYYNPQMVSEAEITQFRQELHLDPDDLVFLALAEFSPRKHHQDILQAFAKLERADVHLVLGGDGPLKAQIQQLAIELEIQDRVHFLGIRQDVPTLISASVATIMASEQEGLPRSIMESLCLETPVIGSKIRGVEDLLANGSGLLFEVEDISGLTKSMNWILDNPQEAQQMGKQGRQNMSNYSEENVISLHEELYAEALN